MSFWIKETDKIKTIFANGAILYLSIILLIFPAQSLAAPGTIEGTIMLSPDALVSVEIEAYRKGSVEGRAVRVGSGAYIISSLSPEVYSVEATAPGYEIKSYPSGVTVTSGGTASNIDISLNAAWPIFQQDRRHSGNSLDTRLNPPLALKWSYLTAGIVQSSPSISNGVIYFGSNDRQIYAVKEDGTLKWSFYTLDSVASTPLISNGTIYVGSADHKLYAISENGVLRWSFPSGGAIIASPAILNGTIYFRSEDKNLYAVDQSGAFKWSFFMGAYTGSTPLAVNGVIYVGSADNKLYAVGEDGALRWSFLTAGSIIFAPSMSNGIIYFGSEDKNLYALYENGTFKWSFTAGAAVYSSAAVANGTIYFGCADNNLYAINDNGTFKWSFPTSAPIYSSPVVCNGIVYIGSSDSNLYAIKNDGTFMWSYATGGVIYSSPSILDGRIYVGSFDNKLYAFVSPDSPGSISGTITLVPDHAVSIEIEASRGGSVEGRAYRTASGAYMISGLSPGVYSVEASAPGYEIRDYLGAVTVNPDSTTAGIDIDLNAAWPMFRQDGAHTGNSPNTMLAPPLKLKWSYSAGSAISSSPAIVNGRVFIGSMDNNVYALDEFTGALIWSYATGDWVQSSPAVVNGKVFVGSKDKKIYALDESTGSSVWSFATLGEVQSSPLVANGRVFVGSFDRSIYALDEGTGALIWSYSVVGAGEIYSSPARGDGRIYIGSKNTGVYGINENTGALVWSYATGLGIFSSPSFANGRVFIGSSDNNVYALEGSTGAFVWSYPTGGFVVSSPSVADGKVFVGSLDNNIYALDESTGALIWSYTTLGVVRSSPSVANGVVYAASYDNKIYALDENTGAFLSSYDAGSVIESSPSIADGMLFIGRWLNDIYAFESLALTRIYSVKFDGILSNPDPAAVNVVAPEPLLEANITVEADGGHVTTVEVYVDAVRVTEKSKASWASQNPISFSYRFRQELSAGPRTIKIKAFNNYGTFGEKEVSVRVGGRGAAEIVGEPVIYPSPFKPLSGERATIAYNLSVDAGITLRIYDISGRAVWTRKFGAGQNGGRLGYNSVVWNGTTDFGRTASNGIYVVQIISGGKLLKTMKIAVFD